MNTIKVYLAESGRVADLKKDFPLYQGQYQNKLLNVFVPTSIMAPSFTSQSASGVVLADYVASTSVKIGMTYTARDGSIKVSKNYYMRYLKTLTYQGIEYALYERKLPQEFTLYAGQGANAPILIANVVNIEQQTENGSPVVLSVITSQTCALDVMASTNLDQDESIEPSELDNINAQLNALNGILPTKQDKVDNAISLPQFQSQKSVVGALNDIGGQTAANTSDIDSNTTDISELQTRVTNLEDTLSGAETPIGTLRGGALPTDAQLTNFTISQVARQPRPNDSVIFILVLAGATNKNYKYIYSSQGLWNGYEIPPIEQAENGSLGIIRGTYGVRSTNNILVDITGGEIKGIYYLDSNGIFHNIRTKINLFDVTQTNIINGKQVVGISTKAIQDQLGDVINLTYAKQSDVYTKTESDNKYLPSTYTNIYYYSASGLVDDIPTTPVSGIQFTKTVNTVGTTNIFSINRALEGNYNFTKNSTDISALWVSANRDCTLEFRLTTNIQKQGTPTTLLSAELTGEIVLTANTPTLISIPAVYSALGNAEFKASAGDIFTKTFDVITTESTATTIDVYSNAVYPSTFNLAAQSIVFDINTIDGLKPINIAQSDWTDNNDGTYSVVIPQTRHQQAPSTNYMLALQEMVAANTYQRVAFTPTIDTDGNITITAYEAVACVLLIGSAIASEERGILTLTNPTTLPNINYSEYGALRVIQTEAPTALTLPAPINVSKFYTFFIANDQTSTFNILFNGSIIEKGVGMQFKWNGANWVLGEQSTATDEVYDKDKSQLLSKTLTDIQADVSANATKITNLENNKLSVDLGNVILDSLKEKVFDCDLNIVKYTETKTAVDLTSLDYDEFYKVQLVFDFDNDNETITQTIPVPQNTTFDIYIALGNNATTHTGCQLILSPVAGVKINGTGSPITLTQDGFVGTLEPTTSGWTWVDKTKVIPPTQNGITLDNGTTALHDVQKIKLDPPSGLEYSQDTTEQNSAILRIKPNILMRLNADAYLAQLNDNEYINPATAHALDAKIWGDNVLYGGGSYVYDERTTKSVIVNPVENENQTPYKLKFVVDFGDAPALSDGYVEAYIQDNTTDTILTDDNGNPMGVKVQFKQGQTMNRLVIGAIKTFDVSTKIGFVVENGFNEVLELTEQTYYCVQALSETKKVSPADNKFDIATGLRWVEDFRYYYTDLLDTAWLKNETIAEATLPAGAYNYNDGLHLDVVNPVKISATGGSVKLEDDGTNLMYCGFGKVFDRIDTANLKGKTLNMTFKGTNKTDAWNMCLLLYTGDNAGQFTTRIVNGYSNGQMVLNTGWTSSSQIFITEDISGDHEVTGTFNIPNTNFNRMAILLVPVGNQQPNSIEFSQFNASLTNGFTYHSITPTISVREEALRYNNNYAKFEFTTQGFQVVRYTINSGATKLPFGVKVNGTAKIDNVSCWVDNSKLKGEGGLFFTNKDKVSMRMQVPIHRGEGAVAGTNETLTLSLYRRTAGTNTDPFNIANFTQIAGTTQSFTIKPTDTDTFYLNYIAQFTFNKAGETLILVGQSSHDMGSYINITQSMPLITNIQGIELV